MTSSFFPFRDPGEGAIRHECPLLPPHASGGLYWGPGRFGCCGEVEAQGKGRRAQDLPLCCHLSAPNSCMGQLHALLVTAPSSFSGVRPHPQMLMGV
jgi:hypothetical protein